MLYILVAVHTLLSTSVSEAFSDFIANEQNTREVKVSLLVCKVTPAPPKPLPTQNLRQGLLIRNEAFAAVISYTGGTMNVTVGSNPWTSALLGRENRHALKKQPCGDRG